MTETSCVISSMDEGDNLTGHVGSPNPACGKLFLLSFFFFLHIYCILKHIYSIIMPRNFIILGRKYSGKEEQERVC